MRNGKHVLRALGLSFLAALGLMAFMAAGAQAKKWMSMAYYSRCVITGTGR